MDRKTMIDAIYDKIADKTLSEGCIIQTRENSCDICSPGEYCGHKQYFWKGSMGYDETIWFDRGRIKLEDGISFGEWFGYKIIGHQISLARILHYLGENSAKNYLTSYETTGIAKVETEYDYSFEWILIKDGTDAILDDQSDNTIETIYDLLFS